ncbi:hydrogenase maturation peptidase HycI [Methanobrevibacter sp. DSM 116169]|uniref:hydrogenase maturation peptidase HycI n=1 Tax=Methanobrevibacter sp. DSM 116169 TaxID=3242727 RepID=UPI0038FCE52E
MGVGNSLKSDDGLGPYIIEKLGDLTSNNLVLINGSTAPENFTGLIKRENPSHIIIIDATLMDKTPGHIQTFHEDDFKNVNMSTHAMSLSYLIKYLKQYSDFKILFIGIQPENLDFSFELTENVEKSSLKLVDLIKSFFI